MKYILTLFFLCPIFVFAQDFSDNWEDLFSYNQIQDLAYGNGKVFAAAQNAVFTYQRNSGEVEKISSINGLSGENISSIHYSSGYNLLIVGYENGLIDIYDSNEKKVLKVIDIFEKQTIPPPEKRINHFYEYNDRLLISTDFGISEYNLANREFGDTYFIGDGGSRLKVNQITVYQNFIYAATEENGIKFAGINNPNLIDFNVWQTISSGTFLGVVSLANSLYAVDENNNLQRLQQNSLISEIQFEQSVRDLRVSDDRLVVGLVNRVRVYDQVLNPVASVGKPSGVNVNYTSALIFLDEIFIGDNQAGLLKTTTTNPFNFNYLSPDGPLRNDVFDLESIPNELWVTYGDYDLFFNPYNPGLKSFGVSHFLENIGWSNIPYSQLNARSIAKATINPNQTDQVFLSSFFDGLIELQNEEVVARYDALNSSFESVEDPNAPSVINDVRVNGAAFDREGNLWGNASRVEKGLFKLDVENNQLQTFDVTSAVPDPIGDNLGFTELVIDSGNNIFFGSYSSGIVGYNPSTNTFVTVQGEEVGNLPDNYVTALTFDNNNQLWVGTLRGLRVLFNPAGVFTDPNLQTNEIIIRDDDGVAQELLAEISILAITVDGNNNKWVATNAGAFYLSANGQETIYQFTKSNSPLPSNTITDISIDENSGKVYIGTDKGLLAFNGTATSSQETLENVRAFPNPVRPNYSGMVTIDGLMENANVKLLISKEIWFTKKFPKEEAYNGIRALLESTK
ncbi:two-component regulator propeller domain-containing protein [Mesonia maritima]|uniref:type IX secretion system anionic LPS delivery protein PorZ n=1 Tax=Mesonia maritima TaxID=1793873 RepID=UPI003629562E